jgi:hypothetical protein
MDAEAGDGGLAGGRAISGRATRGGGVIQPVTVRIFSDYV